GCSSFEDSNPRLCFGAAGLYQSGNLRASAWLWANLRLGSAGCHHNIFFKSSRNKACSRAFGVRLRQRPAGADQPGYCQPASAGCATTALRALRNCSLVAACVALRAWYECAAKACGADAAISASATVLKTILRMMI